MEREVVQATVTQEGGAIFGVLVEQGEGRAGWEGSLEKAVGRRSTWAQSFVVGMPIFGSRR